jgi:Flp pilus assembly protein TadD
VVVPESDTEKNAAHDLYLKGRFEWNQRTPDSLNRALDDFTQAIVHNPNDAHAYTGLADAYEMLYIYGDRRDDDARDRAMAAARKAIELDSSLSEAHRALGYAIWRSGNFTEAEQELHLAIQLDPKDSLSHLWLANVLASHGEDVECLAEINRAQELDPASASILAIKGDRLYWLGSKDEGIALLKAAEHSEPRLANRSLVSGSDCLSPARLFHLSEGIRGRRTTSK